MNRDNFDANIGSQYHPNLKCVAQEEVKNNELDAHGNTIKKPKVQFERYVYTVRDKQFVVLWTDDSEGKSEGQIFIPADLPGLETYLDKPIKDEFEKSR